MKRLFFLLSLLLTACDSLAAVDSAATAASTPTPMASPDIVATGTAANGEPITVAVTAVDGAHRMQVTRGIKDDGRPEIILRYHVGPHQRPTPWVDVYTLTQARLMDVSNEHPELYQVLQEKYQAMLPDYEAAASNGWPEALNALKRRIAMAEAITERDR